MSVWTDIMHAIFGQPPAPEVDVEAILAKRAETRKELNWRTSIVDLLKLLDLPSSVNAREELGRDLGYDGMHSAGSPEKNEWLRKAVMRELAKNGGKVPASMLD